MTDLFREEAVVHQARRLKGEVLVGSRLPWVLLGYILSAIVLGIILCACFAHYSRKETVEGVLLPKAGLIRLTAREGGVITGLTAEEGGTFHAGQSLATLKVSADTGAGNSGSLIENATRSERDAARSNGLAQIEKVRADAARLQARRTVLEQQIRESESLRDLLVSKKEIAEQTLNRTKELSRKQFGSQQSVENAMLAVMSIQQEIVSANSAILALKKELVEVISDLRNIPLSLNQAASQLQSTDASMEQKLQKARTANEYDVTAPMDGVVLAVPARIGQSVSAGTSLVVITPIKSPLEAELYITSRSIGFIQPGQDVSLQYEGFSYKTFGSGRGRIVSISRSPLTPADATMYGVDAKEPVYRARVALTKDYIQAYGKSIPLQAGMLLKADIVVQRRTILQWLFDPLYAVGKKQ